MLVRRTSSRPRRGSNLVEAAIVLPIALMFILGTCVIGLGVYRYQQVASLAREGARYASVHGSTGTPASASQIFTTAIQPMAVGLNLSSANNVVVQWGNYNTATNTWTWLDWDSSSKSPTSYNPNSTPPGEPLYNSVRVTVSYQWTPQLYIAGPINLTSTSEMPMSY